MDYDGFHLVPCSVARRYHPSSYMSIIYINFPTLEPRNRTDLIPKLECRREIESLPPTWKDGMLPLNTSGTIKMVCRMGFEPTTSSFVGFMVAVDNFSKLYITLLCQLSYLHKNGRRGGGWTHLLFQRRFIRPVLSPFRHPPIKRDLLFQPEDPSGFHQCPYSIFKDLTYK